MKQGGEEAENCGKEKENDLQKANAQSEDHPFLELVPITPPFDVSRFDDYNFYQIKLVSVFVCLYACILIAV